ncbi:hypothetical protein AWC22_05045 [Mycobacterium riyadhense]|uniref:Uncharacterized protein n=1 Tax=Mycobacterium riyadhense TaxID=486698 RepID=A0A1X2BE75_9MYCO|nr:hypothetical protein AWC22_05045 [Mycobacterium riyadhense]
MPAKAASEPIRSGSKEGDPSTPPTGVAPSISPLALVRHPTDDAPVDHTRLTGEASWSRTTLVDGVEVAMVKAREIADE